MTAMRILRLTRPVILVAPLLAVACGGAPDEGTSAEPGGAPGPAAPAPTAAPAPLDTAETLVNRAVGAMEAGDWTRAAEEFSGAISLAPDDLELRLGLGTALINGGDGVSARRAFLEAERLSPQSPEPQYALGTLYAMAGDYRASVERLMYAATLDPENPAARLTLADVLRQDDRPAAAVQVYAEILDADASIVDAQFGLGVALVQLERWAEARDVLAVGMNRFPEDIRFPHAVVRLLAASPDPDTRDGLAGLQIVEEIALVQPDNIEVGETMAMVMAENGIWVDALNWQRGTLEGARTLGADPAMVAWLEDNLARYERSEPARRPWRPDHPIFRPVGPPSPGLLP
jgi:tetratricopeptide (TPR) repeat protein